MPTIRHNDHEITWEQRPPKHSVPAIGLRRIVRAHCTVAGPFDHCPNNKRSGFCHDWHPDYELVRGWTLDDVLVGTGEHAVTFHQDRKRQVSVVLADSIHVYAELTGVTGEFTPGNRARLLRSADDDGTRECTAVRATLPAPPPSIEHRYHDPDGSRLATIRRMTAQYPACAVCKRPMVSCQAGAHLSCRSATTPTTNGTSR